MRCRYTTASGVIREKPVHDELRSGKTTLDSFGCCAGRVSSAWLCVLRGLILLTWLPEFIPQRAPTLGAGKETRGQHQVSTPLPKRATSRSSTRTLPNEFSRRSHRQTHISDVSGSVDFFLTRPDTTDRIGTLAGSRGRFGGFGRIRAVPFWSSYAGRDAQRPGGHSVAQERHLRPPSYAASEPDRARRQREPVPPPTSPRAIGLQTSDGAQLDPDQRRRRGHALHQHEL